MRFSLHALLRFLRGPKKKNKNGHHFTISHEKVKQMTKQMNELMEQRQPFLQPGYTISMFANDLNIPAYQLSALLNRQIGINFNDYLNGYRIKYCKGLIREGTVANLNLKGLSKQCGFSNRNTFTNAFKKFTGRTPSDYTKHHEEFEEL